MVEVRASANLLLPYPLGTGVALKALSPPNNTLDLLNRMRVKSAVGTAGAELLPLYPLATPCDR